MGTGGTPTLGSPKGRLLKPHNACAVRPAERLWLNIDVPYKQITEADLVPMVAARGAAGGVEGKFYSQAERAISNGKLNILLCLHLRPINVVVFHGPY
jgi:hypothetical protein